MRRAVLIGVAAALCVALGHAVAAPPNDNDPKPQYTGDKLIRPEGYREWIYLSSGLGMNYNPSAGGGEMFTNAFVPPWAYRQFMASGKWPDRTIFVLEERASQTKGSINKTGHFQTDLAGLAVEVKDAAKFPADTWAYFGFGPDTKTAEANPKQNCWQCHNDHAAVEHSFVQFYPTLKPIAQKFGTYRQQAESTTP
ncbi:MAG TPA: cytochrome P460 family protein [Verrucomicrobiae bacterium]|nr:cytochrome P460 family protein [Verrucomicrobiae bacterium]